ncbi:hypothetical protein SBV1_630021 [Verrucomicrobia bacterium]|nr:hypothetical protein SBV1_630021 [Verrucomicrobiota bacterium]
MEGPFCCASRIVRELGPEWVLDPTNGACYFRVQLFP